jgi:hypothetical protein
MSRSYEEVTRITYEGPPEQRFKKGDHVTIECGRCGESFTVSLPEGKIASRLHVDGATHTATEWLRDHDQKVHPPEKIATNPWVQQLRVLEAFADALSTVPPDLRREIDYAKSQIAAIDAGVAAESGAFARLANIRTPDLPDDARDDQ